jgi:6-phosphogluconolactonase
MDLRTYPDAEMMMMDVANILAGALESALYNEGRVTLAVPGGTTPGPIFDSLCAVSLDWGRVDILLTDERWVPESSDRSNTRLLRQRLLTDKASSATLIPIYAEGATPEDRLDELAATIMPLLPLNICLLGMGADMHTASLFPGADQLDAALTGDDILYAMRAPGAPEPRVTLSAKVLQGAVQRHIVITGADKRAALDRAMTLTPAEAPVAAILADTTVHWAES